MIARKSIFLMSLICLVLIQPAFAALAVSMDQKIIVINQIVDDKMIIALDGSVFEISSSEAIKQVRKLKNQQVHILYVDIGDKMILSELKPATEPPFVIPKLGVSKKSKLK